MSYTVQSLNGCTKKFVFNFETVDLSKEIKQALEQKQRNSNLKGFRKGKAPLDIIRRLYGPQLENEALSHFISSQFFDAVKGEGLVTVGYPTFSNTQYEPEKKSVSFDAVVEVFPELELKDMSKLSFKKDDTKVTDEEVEENKTRYLASKSVLVEVTDEQASLKNGQFAVINFQGEKADGERPENMKGQEYVLEIGSNQFIPGFEEGLVGMKKGEKKDLNLTFPAEYHMPDLQNANVKFEVELLEIKEKKLPELNDELAKEFGFESVEDFHKKNRESLEYRKEHAATSKLQQEILEKLVEENKFDVPKSMIDEQKKTLMQDVKQNLLQQGLGEKRLPEYFEKWGEEIEKKAEFQVKSGLILDSLAKKYDIQVSDKDLQVKFDEMAKQSGMPVDEIKKYYTGNENLKRNLKYAVREELTFKKVLEQVKVK